MLVKEAGRIAKISHSMWAFYLLVLGAFAPELAWVLLEHETDPYMRLYAMGGATIYGAVGRLIDQGSGRGIIGKVVDWLPRLLILAVLLMSLMGMSRFITPDTEPEKPGAVTVAEFVEIGVPLVAKWEGKRNVAYLDRIARPPVWTVCYGETRGVKQGDRYTDKQCADMLRKGLLEYRVKLYKYYTPETEHERLTPDRDAAYVSFAWNVGTYGAGKSTAVKRLNAGDIAGGCKAMTWWNKAGGRVVLGLVNRRKDEYSHCMRGLT